MKTIDRNAVNNLKKKPKLHQSCSNLLNIEAVTFSTNRKQSAHVERMANVARCFYIPSILQPRRHPTPPDSTSAMLSMQISARHGKECIFCVLEILSKSCQQFTGQHRQVSSSCIWDTLSVCKTGFGGLRECSSNRVNPAKLNCNHTTHTHT